MYQHMSGSWIMVSPGNSGPIVQFSPHISPQSTQIKTEIKKKKERERKYTDQKIKPRKFYITV